MTTLGPKTSALLTKRQQLLSLQEEIRAQHPDLEEKYHKAKENLHWARWWHGLGKPAPWGPLAGYEETLAPLLAARQSRHKLRFELNQVLTDLLKALIEEHG